MPRNPRLFVAGGYYHVYCRTQRGEYRFDDRVEAGSFVESALEVSSSHKLDILGWCLMANHYHLVVRTSDVQLWRSMARLHGKVTRDHNRRHRVFGPGWQCRYRARLIQDSDDLRNLFAYVHLNPVMAGVVDDPAMYKLSGHRPLIGISDPILVDVRAALMCFSTERREARQVYLDHVRSVAEAKWAHQTLRKLPWWRVVTDDHQTVTEEAAPSEARTFDDRHPNFQRLERGTVECLLRRAAPLLGCRLCEIKGPGRGSDVAQARRRFAFIAALRFNHSLKSIGEAVGKSSSQVSRWLTHQIDVYYSDPGESDLIDRISVSLLTAQN